ncbi:MAG: fdrA domain protein [Nitrospirota bacterium]
MVKEAELIHQPMKVINIGIDSFIESLKEQGVEVIHVDWRPPAGGDSRLIDILDKLEL